jgi:colicin import membrane protein
MIEMIEPVEAPVAVSSTALALTQVGTQIAARDQLEADFAEMELRYANVVYDVSTPKGLETAKQARLEVRQVRFNVQNATKDVCSQINAAKVSFSAGSDALIERILKTETPIDEQIKAEEARKELAKAAKEQEERDLATKIQAAIDVFTLDLGLISADAQTLTAAIEEINQTEVSLEVFGVRAGEAQQRKLATLAQLHDLRVATQSREKMQAEMAEQTRQLAEAKEALAAITAQAAAAEAARVEQARLDREQEEARVAKQAADEKAIADEAARVKQEQEDAARLAARLAADEAQRVIDVAAAAERAKKDFEAATERQRLDDIAAAERAEAKRAADAKQAEIDRDNAKAALVRDAADPLLLALLDLVTQVDLIPLSSGIVLDTSRAQRAINLALTGEK